MNGNVLAELLSKQLRTEFPEAMAEVRARTPDELIRPSDGGSDIAGLPAGLDVDTKVIAASKPSNVTQYVGDNLVSSDAPSMLSFFEQKGGLIRNEDLTDAGAAVRRFLDQGQGISYNLRGHVPSEVFLQNHYRQRLNNPKNNPHYVLNDPSLHQSNEALVNYLRSQN